MPDLINDLPKNWIWTSIGEISDKIHYGYTASAKKNNTGIKLLRITDIQDSVVDWESVPYCNINENELNKYELRKGDLLFARTGATVGKSYLVRDIPTESVFASYLIRIVLNECINKLYIYLYFQSLYYWNQIRSKSLGIGQPNINASILGKLKLPLPPLPEQHRIVAKIEELFSELDAGVAALKKAKSMLETYRQAVLKAAFEGRQKNENIKIGGLADNWKWYDLGKTGILKRGKSKHRPRNDIKLFGGKYPFIQTGDVKAANGGYIRNYHQTYNDYGLSQSKLWSKDTLCITIAANIAETAFLGFDACFPDSIVGYIPYHTIVTKEYVNYYLISVKTNIEELAPATAQKNINLSILDKVKIPIPSLEEQCQITTYIEERFALANNLVKKLEKTLNHVMTIKQSILKQAFSGRLVPQNLDDEPAEILLERIKKLKN